MVDSSNNTAINGYFQQKIYNEIIKKTNASSDQPSETSSSHSIKFKSYHAKLLEKKLDDGWNRMRGKMKKFVDYNAPNSDYSSDEECNYESSYSYKFFFQSFALSKEKEHYKKKEEEAEIEEKEEEKRRNDSDNAKLTK